MAATARELVERPFQTLRQDAWRREAAAIAVGLTVFIVYATIRAFMNSDYEYHHPHQHILSPFYSPKIVWPGMPSWLSPAFFILWIPAGFRLTCYYFRKAYYRAYFASPPACAVGARPEVYHGETRWLLFQNLHRLFLYFAILLWIFLAIDLIPAFFHHGGFGVSVGSLVLFADVILVGLYTFSCHSFRHMVGGNVDCFSCTAGGSTRFKLWRGVSILNERHRDWAWWSLFLVGFADFYVWMVASGVIGDPRII